MDVTLGLALTASLRQAWPMTGLAVRCLHWHRTPSGTRGTTRRGPQRSRCPNVLCPRGRLLRADRNRGGLPEGKQHLLTRRLNASGGRATAQSLPSSPPWTACTQKARRGAGVRAHRAAAHADPGERCRGHAARGRSCAGRHEVLCRRQRTPTLAVACQGSSPGCRRGVWLWSPSGCGLVTAPRAPGAVRAACHDSTDHWGASRRHRAPDEPPTGTRHPQTIARKPLPLRTRLKRWVCKTQLRLANHADA